MLGRVVPCFRDGSAVIVLSLVDQFPRFRECLTDYQPFIVGDVNLSECLHHEAIRLTSALTSRTAIQSLVFRPCHKYTLPWLG